MTISIIIPTYNEKDNIKNLINVINLNLDIEKILIIDDSINNIIAEEIKNFKNVEYIFRGKKLGRGSAILEGLKYSLQNYKNEIFIEMDADFSHDPKELIKNLKLFNLNKCDLLIASRYLKESAIVNWPYSRKILSFLANKLAKHLLKVPVTDYTNGYRIYSKPAVIHILKNCGNVGDGFIILSEILVELYYNNFKLMETYSKFINRIKGTSSVSLKEIINSLIGLIKIYKLKNKLLLKKKIN
jgi:dolichol-phosphate mannosyltransferase